MTTLKDALARGTRLLAQGDLPYARLEAQMLLSHVVGLERAVLYAYPERTLTPEQEQYYFQLLARRQQHEPVAYLTGERGFYGLDFMVDKRVLIPRPETELLVETALVLIRQRLASGQIPLVADIGTGSGAIPVTIAVEEAHLPYIYACDVSPDALVVALLNSQRHHVSERVRFLQGDLLAPLPEAVDLLLANLPYVGTDEMAVIESDVHAYEPHLALFSGPDGLGLLRRLAHELQQSAKLRPGATVLLEIGYQQSETLTQIFRAQWPMATITVRKDYAGFNRLLQVNI